MLTRIRLIGSAFIVLSMAALITFPIAMPGMPTDLFFGVLTGSLLLVLGAGLAVEAGGVEPVGKPRLNLNRHGMPLDYATYEWLLYDRVVEDDSPARRAFLNGAETRGGWEHPNFGEQLMWR